jgi:hypothetical protein
MAPARRVGWAQSVDIARGHPSRLAEDGEHLRMTIELVAAS